MTTPRFGVCYYPEQWPRDRWAVDAARMADVGFDLVRIGEFAWSSYEPRRGEFTWDWLDEAVDTLGGAGLGVVLGTPTATPPVWLMREHPEVLSVGPDGRRRSYGSRRHTCPTSETYRAESRRIVTALLDRYGDHEAIVAWQVDNEPGNHDSARCWCVPCSLAFTRWLEERFGSIEALNQAWGTQFWSLTYPDFAAVELPVQTMTHHHPALRLAHLRFASDQAVGFIAQQYDLIRQRRADLPVTTNLYLGDVDIDATAVARLGGLSSHDNYPHGLADATETAFVADLSRWAAGPDGAAWIMEQQPGPVNWTAMNPPVPDGQVRVWLWQAVMHGISAVLMFRWRAARHGQEIYHSGLLRQDGSRTRALDEVRETIAEVRSLTVELGPRPRIALVHSYDDAWAISVNPHRRGLTHRDLLLPVYRALRRHALDVAVVPPGFDLDGFDYVFAPAFHITTPERLDWLADSAEAGTVVVLGPRSLVIDDEYAWSDQPLPAGFSQRVGATVTDQLSNTLPVTVDPFATPAGPWVDALEPDEGAAVLARYAGGTFLDGRAAAVRSGQFVYAGFSDVATWTALVSTLVDRPVLVPEGTEVFERSGLEVTIDHTELTVGLQENESK